MSDALEETAKLYDDAARELHLAARHARSRRSTSATGRSRGAPLMPGLRAVTFSTRSTAWTSRPASTPVVRDPSSDERVGSGLDLRLTLVLEALVAL